MTVENFVAPDIARKPTKVDIGHPVELLVDPDDHDVVLGVTYQFSVSGARKTVWYTANKRRPKHFAIVTEFETE
jgi:hypothetical protein